MAGPAVHRGHRPRQPVSRRASRRQRREPAHPAATLTVALRGSPWSVRIATMRWGQQWPPASAPNVPPPPGPVSILCANSYTLLVSSDGHTWHAVAGASGRTTGTVDVLHFAPIRLGSSKCESRPRPVGSRRCPTGSAPRADGWTQPPAPLCLAAFPCCWALRRTAGCRRQCPALTASCG
jgi:hypothetical protein